MVKKYPMCLQSLTYKRVYTLEVQDDYFLNGLEPKRRHYFSDWFHQQFRKTTVFFWWSKNDLESIWYIYIYVYINHIYIYIIYIDIHIHTYVCTLSTAEPRCFSTIPTGMTVFPKEKRPKTTQRWGSCSTLPAWLFEHLLRRPGHPQSETHISSLLWLLTIGFWAN